MLKRALIELLEPGLKDNTEWLLAQARVVKAENKMLKEQLEIESKISARLRHALDDVLGKLEDDK